MTSETMTRAEALVTTCAERTWRLACALVWNPEDARDVVQQAFLVATAKAGSIPPDNPWPWFARVLALEALKLRTARAKRVRLSAELLGHEPAMNTTDPAQDSDNRDLNARLQSALLELSSDLREALSLTQIGGMSVRDAAETLGVSSSTLDRRVQEGIGQLRRKLGVTEVAASNTLMALPFAAPPEGMTAAIKGWLSAVRLEQSLIGGTAATGVKIIGATLMAKYMILALAIVLAVVLAWFMVFKPGSEADARRHNMRQSDIAAAGDSGRGKAPSVANAMALDEGKGESARPFPAGSARKTTKPDAAGGPDVTTTKLDPPKNQSGTADIAPLTPKGTAGLLSAEKSKQQAPLRVLGAPGPWDNGSPINCLEITPDGKTIVTGSNDGKVSTWELATGRKLASRPAHEYGVEQLALTADGKTAITSSGNQLKICNLDDGRQVQLPLADDQHDIRGRKQSADGQKVAAIVYTGLRHTVPGRLIIWKLADQSQIVSAELPPGQFHSLAYVSGTEEIVVAGDALLRFDAATGRQIERLELPPTNNDRSTWVSPDGKKVAAWEDSRHECRVLDAKTLTVLRTLRIQYSAEGDDSDVVDPGSISWRSDSQQILLCTLAEFTAVDIVNGTVVAHASTGLGRKPPEGKARRWFDTTLTDAQLSPDSTHIVGAGENGRLVVWDVAASKAITPEFEADGFAAFAGTISGLAFTPDGKRLAVSDGQVSFWDLSSGTRAETPAIDSGKLKVEGITPNGQYCVLSSENNWTRCYSLADLQLRYTLSPQNDGMGTDMPDSVSCKAFCASRPLMITSHNYKMFLWDTETGHCLRTYVYAENELQSASVQFSADGKTFVTGHWGGGVRIWDTDTLKPILEIKASAAGRTISRFAPDGQSVLACAENGDVRQFNVVDGKLLRELRISDKDYADVLSLEFIPGTTRFVVSYSHGSEGPQLKVFDLGNSALVAHFAGHDGVVTALAISPDGKTLATGGEDRVVKLWDLSVLK